MKEFAKHFKYERELHSWSQEQVAEMLGTTGPNVSRWERGITFPNPYFRQKLCELFGKSVEELGLFEAANDMSIPSPDQAGEHQALSLSAPVVSPLRWHLPHQRNPLFTGREEVLIRLLKVLNSGNAAMLAQAQAISGLGGIGKTQVATEYAYRYSDAYQSIFWVRAETRDVLLSDFGALAEVLKLTEQVRQHQHSAVEAVKSWLNEHTDWLLILDNIEELSLLHEFIPFQSKGHIILTTRSQSTGPRIQRIDLEKMEPGEGALFLLRRAKRLGPKDPLERASSADCHMATEIYRLMDGLPLALDQAGAYIEEAACSLSHYVDLLQSHQAVLLGLRNLSGEIDIDHPYSVRATFSLSLERIKRVNPAAIELLHLCAFLHPDAIPEEMITEGAPDLSPFLQNVASDPLKLDVTIAELRKYSLVHRNPDAKTLSIHRLVQAVIKDTMEETLQRQWVQRAVQVVNRVSPQVDAWVTLSLCQRYFPHAQVCATLIEAWDIVTVEAGRLLTHLAYYIHELSQYELTPYAQAEPLLEKALAILTSNLGAEHPGVADAHRALGWAYATGGKYAQAEVYCQKALAILEHMPEPDHRSIVACLNDLAGLYQDQGKYTQAEPLYQRAVDICERLLEPEDLDVAANLHNLGICYRYQGKYAQAEPLLLRALDISQKVLGMEHPFTANGMNALGKLFLAQGQYAQAESLLLQTLELRQKVLNPGHPDIAYTLNALGRLFLAQGQYAQAEPPLLQAFEIHQKALGPDHPLTAQMLKDLTDLYAVQ